MRRVGVHRQAFVAVARGHQQVEIVRAHGGCAGVNFVREINPQLLGVGANLGRLLDKSFLAFGQQIIIAAFPEAPRITRRHLPAERDAPKHRHDLDVKGSGQIKEFEQISLGPLFEFRRRTWRPRPAAETGAPSGLSVQAVVCTQIGQCAETPSKVIPREAKGVL